MHYQNSEPNLRQNMYEYLTLIERGYSVEETFRHVFEISFDEFDKRVNDYISGRFVSARVFDIGASGIEFPKVSVDTQALLQRGALEFLYPKLALLSPNLISEEEIERMITGLEQLVPDFSITVKANCPVAASLNTGRCCAG